MIPNSQIPSLYTYEPGRPLEEVAREIGFGDAHAITKLASNENPLGPSPAAIHAMRAQAEQMHIYPDGGAYYLRQALAEQLNVPPDSLIFGTGSNELIVFLGHVFLGPGTNLVMSEQAFIIYHLVAASFGAETRMIPSKDFGHDLQAMAEAVDENTRLFCIANPNNPTGTLIDPAELRAVIEGLPEHVLVVLDEAYIELLDTDQRPELHLTRPNLIALRTFSKAYGLAGLRIGYGIAPPELIGLLSKVRQPFNVSAMAQAAALAAIADQAHVDALRTLTRDGLARLQAAADALGIPTVPSFANFILFETGAGRACFEALQQRGVIVRPMDGYSLPEHIRVSVGTREENEHFIRELPAALAEVRGASA